jgi:hypothetical protein
MDIQSSDCQCKLLVFTYFGNETGVIENLSRSYNMKVTLKTSNTLKYTFNF